MGRYVGVFGGICSLKGFDMKCGVGFLCNNTSMLAGTW